MTALTTKEMASTSVFGHQLDNLTGVTDLLPRPQLRPLATLDDAIDRHPARLDFGMGETAGMTEPGSFQQLVELNVVTSHL